MKGIAAIEVEHDPLGVLASKYHVTLAGEDVVVVVVSRRQLFDFYDFLNQCETQAGVSLSPEVQDDWNLAVMEALESAERRENPAFRNLLTAFCAKSGERWGIVLQGRPYEQDDMFAFRMVDLVNFMARRGVRVRRGKLVDCLRAVGGWQGQKTLRGNLHFNYWAVPQTSLLRLAADAKFLPKQLVKQGEPT